MTKKREENKEQGLKEALERFKELAETLTPEARKTLASILMHDDVPVENEAEEYPKFEDPDEKQDGDISMLCKIMVTESGERIPVMFGSPDDNFGYMPLFFDCEGSRVCTWIPFNKETQTIKLPTEILLKQNKKTLDDVGYTVLYPEDKGSCCVRNLTEEEAEDMLDDFRRRYPFFF